MMAHPSYVGPSNGSSGQPHSRQSSAQSDSSALPYLVESPPPTAPLSDTPPPWPTVSSSSNDSTLSPLPLLSALPARTSSITPPHSSRSLSGPPSFTTSNSSLPTGPRNSVAGGASVRSGDELDPTAALIQKLYARLDAQGVSGDGWDEGLERSRDGIINRHDLKDGVASLATQQTSRMDKAVDKQDYILKRVDRSVPPPG